MGPIGFEPTHWDTFTTQATGPSNMIARVLYISSSEDRSEKINLHLSYLLSTFTFYEIFILVTCARDFSSCRLFEKYPWVLTRHANTPYDRLTERGRKFFFLNKFVVRSDSRCFPLVRSKNKPIKNLNEKKTDSRHSSRLQTSVIQLRSNNPDNNKRCIRFNQTSSLWQKIRLILANTVC